MDSLKGKHLSFPSAILWMRLSVGKSPDNAAHFLPSLHHQYFSDCLGVVFCFVFANCPLKKFY